jgi:hypothetical protein
MTGTTDVKRNLRPFVALTLIASSGAGHGAACGFFSICKKRRFRVDWFIPLFLGVLWCASGNAWGQSLSPPWNPPNPAACQQWYQGWQSYWSNVTVQHQQCLDANAKEQSTPVGGDSQICSKPQCQHLHDILYGPQHTQVESALDTCVAQAQANQAQLSLDAEQAAQQHAQQQATLDFYRQALENRRKLREQAAAEAAATVSQQRQVAEEQAARSTSAALQTMGDQQQRALAQAREIDSAPIPDSTSTYNGSSFDPSAQSTRLASAGLQPALSLDDLPGPSVDPPMAGALATSSPLAVITQAEEQEAATLDTIFRDSFHDLVDNVDPLVDFTKNYVKDKPQDTLAEALGAADPLEKGISASLDAILPEAETSIGSALRDTGLDFATSLAADAITNAKDELVCRNSDSAVNHWGCMVLMSSTNLTRGPYNNGKLLVERFRKLMEATQSVMQGTDAP